MKTKPISFFIRRLRCAVILHYCIHGTIPKQVYAILSGKLRYRRPVAIPPRRLPRRFWRRLFSGDRALDFPF